MYREVPARIDNPAEMEAGIIDFWREHEIFDATLAQRADAPRWVFYEGPHGQRGAPAPSHRSALSRMCSPASNDEGVLRPTPGGLGLPRAASRVGRREGTRVQRQNGTSRRTESPSSTPRRESVVRHVDEFARLTERMGYWVDMDAAYWTMDMTTSNRCGGRSSRSSKPGCWCRITG